MTAGRTILRSAVATAAAQPEAVWQQGRQKADEGPPNVIRTVDQAVMTVETRGRFSDCPVIIGAMGVRSPWCLKLCS